MDTLMTEPTLTRTGPDEPETTQPATHQEAPAPPLRITRCLGDLIIGPEASNWSYLLVHQHLSKPRWSHAGTVRNDARLALSQTCRVARDMVLVTAPKARIALQVNEDVGGAWLRGVRKELKTRGTMPTTMQLTGASCSVMSYALGVWEESTHWVDKLVLDCREYLPISFLRAIGRSFPNLTVLNINAALKQTPLPRRPGPEPAVEPVASPSLGEVEKLAELHLNLSGDDNTEDILRAIRPYVQQLKVLKLVDPVLPDAATVWDPPLGLVAPAYGIESPWPAGLLPLVVVPGTIAPHLHTLHTAATLDDQLLDMLLQGAPVLEDLMVYEIELQSDAHMHTETNWTELTAWGTCLHLSTVIRLPAAPHLTLNLEGAVLKLVCDMTGHEETAFTPRCSVYTGIGLKDLSIQPGVEHAADQPFALRAGLQLLRHSEYWGPCFELSEWTVSVEFVQELCNHLPEDTNGVCFGRDLVWPEPVEDPQLYETLLHRLPECVDHVRVGTEGLTDEQLEGICLGASKGRTPDAPLRFQLWSGSCELAEAIHEKMEQLGTFPNVSVRWGQMGNGRPFR